MASVISITHKIAQKIMISAICTNFCTATTKESVLAEIMQSMTPHWKLASCCQNRDAILQIRSYASHPQDAVKLIVSLESTSASVLVNPVLHV